MFTGLIQYLGEVTKVQMGSDSAVIRIKAPKISRELKKGDSVSVNGVCLTALEITKKSFSADVMIQTLKMTSLSSIEVGTLVNLELAALVTTRLGGHIVQGHVDGVGIVKLNQVGEKWAQFDVQVPSHLLKYLQNQGSVSIDGVSLTVGTVDDATSTLTLWLIPETLAETNLGNKKVGDKVNIEVDVLAKYVERLLADRSEKANE